MDNFNTELVVEVTSWGTMNDMYAPANACAWVTTQEYFEPHDVVPAAAIAYEIALLSELTVG